MGISSLLIWRLLLQGRLNRVRSSLGLDVEVPRLAPLPTATLPTILPALLYVPMLLKPLMMCSKLALSTDPALLFSLLESTPPPARQLPRLRPPSSRRSHSRLINLNPKLKLTSNAPTWHRSLS